MIPVGYMLKMVVSRPDWLKTPQVRDLYSVSSCVSPNFADYVQYWQHNGYWLFDSPDIIVKLAKANNIDIAGTTLFYYEAYEYEFLEHEMEWIEFSPEVSFETAVKQPSQKTLEGFDIVSFSCGNLPECSYLSCNHMAESIAVNEHCLLPSLEAAKALIESGVFEGCEPGPCRIFAVYVCS